MREWPSDSTVAHLIFVDHLTVPTTEAIDEAIEHARRKGARVVRTSALFPRATEIMLTSGFEPIDRLALLRRSLDVEERLPPSEGRCRALQPWHHHRAARVDQDAFGLMWGNSAASIRDIRRATPAHHARLIRTGSEIAGFAISGIAGNNGYLQRLAVASDHRREGIARELAIDGLRWMHDRRAGTAFVNTGITNDAALALYGGLGFVRLDDELTIAERRLTE
jgi:ribosomal protein S18 acetylase RimI-like enzyme